ncbi:MAG: alkaline phosphatase PhoX [Candidatus Eisenbacteria bacterium]
MAPPGVPRALAAIARGPRAIVEGYGPLVADTAGLLDLPAGFQYRMFSAGLTEEQRDQGERFTSRLSNGDATPGLHDGMAAFAGPGGVTVLVRNHEYNIGDRPMVDASRQRPYDARAGGGTTTLWVDAERNLVKSFPSLSGTLRNCAGGRTPWNTWLTAEETTYIPGAKNAENADLDPGIDRRHGYVFEVDALHEGLSEPIPLVAMGRFRHEAVAVDPETGYAYLTEDRDDGLLYRYRPAVIDSGKRPSELRFGDYARGGVLEALRIIKQPHAMTSNQAGRITTVIGRSLKVDWVRIPEVDPAMDLMHPPGQPKKELTAPSSTRAQGLALGAATFSRTEGITYAEGSVYFCCTSGGPAKLGQVFRLDLRHHRLTLVVEPEDDAVLDGPDNLCVAPFGDLVICEDSLAKRENFVVGVTERGKCYRIARNAHPSKRELAGACFAPDGRTLFVNVQEPGMTFAIWGPWESRRAK